MVGITQALTRYYECTSFTDIERFLRDFAVGGGYTVVRQLRALFRFTRFTEERLLILKYLTLCEREKALTNALIEFSYTENVDELLLILKGFYKYPDPSFYPRVVDIFRLHKDERVKVYCVRVLGKLGKKDVIPLFDSLFDTVSIPIAYEMLHAILLIGEPVNVRAWEERLRKHKRGNLFLKNKHILQTFVSLIHFCGGQGRDEALRRYTRYPEGEIALLAGTYLNLTETETYLLQHDKRRAAYHTQTFFRLIQGEKALAIERERKEEERREQRERAKDRKEEAEVHANDEDDAPPMGTLWAGAERLKAREVETAETKDRREREAEQHDNEKHVAQRSTSYDRYAFLYCKKHARMLEKEMKTFLRDRVFSFDKYEHDIRVSIENVAQLQVPFITTFLWEMYRSVENKYVLAAILDNIQSEDDTFITDVVGKLQAQFIETTSTLLIRRIPSTIVALKKAHALSILLSLATKMFAGEKEEAIFHAIYDMLVNKGYYTHLRDDEQRMLRSFIDHVVTDDYSAKAKETVATLIARLRLFAYETFLLARFRDDRYNMTILEAMITLHTDNIETELLSLFADETYYTYHYNVMLKMVLKHFADYPHETLPLSDEVLSRTFVIPNLMAETATVIGMYGRRSLAPLLMEYFEHPRANYLVNIRIIEALGNLRSHDAFPLFMRYLYKKDYLAALVAGHAINRLETREGFDELLTFCARTSVPDDVKVRVLEDIAIVYDNAMETIVRIAEILEHVTHPVLHERLLEVKMHVELEDRLSSLKQKLASR